MDKVQFPNDNQHSRVENQIKKNIKQASLPCGNCFEFPISQNRERLPFKSGSPPCGSSLLHGCTCPSGRLPSPLQNLLNLCLRLEKKDKNCDKTISQPSSGLSTDVSLMAALLPTLQDVFVELHIFLRLGTDPRSNTSLLASKCSSLSESE